ncbi:hypothetical protein LCGC14_0323410 [marine sediment metagenome]|uniref:Uncharacterized protein n=1 Tax=marine sediment metagenome TaxID=412755 RepID=A0A0F9U1D9_9ZZZZ
MIEVTATIEKRQISELGKLKGKANAQKITLGGEEHDPGHLQFCGFAGRRGPDKRWHGAFRFEPCAGGSCPVIAFDFLTPAKPRAQAAKPQTTKPEKGRTRDEHR